MEGKYYPRQVQLWGGNNHMRWSLLWCNVLLSLRTGWLETKHWHCSDNQISLLQYMYGSSTAVKRFALFSHSACGDGGSSPNLTVLFRAEVRFALSARLTLRRNRTLGMQEAITVSIFTFATFAPHAAAKADMEEKIHTLCCRAVSSGLEERGDQWISQERC